MKIAVYGSSSSSSEDASEKAYIVGKELAKQGHTLLTGAGKGLPYDSVKGFNEVGGESVGFSASINESEHVKSGSPIEGFTEIVFIHEDFEHVDNRRLCINYRLNKMVAEADAGIVIGGGSGTLSEFALTFNTGKNIGILSNTGGITKSTLQAFFKDVKKETGSRVIWSESPSDIVKKLSQSK